VLLTVDTASALPLFEQLVTGIRGQIIGGTLAAGDRLPAARDLAASLDVNVHTVLRAYQILRDEGFVDLRRGRGAIVADRAVDYRSLASSVDRLVAEAKTLDLTPGALSALIREAWEK
jgi:GntR family transcriptional regulator